MLTKEQAWEVVEGGVVGNTLTEHARIFAAAVVDLLRKAYFAGWEGHALYGGEAGGSAAPNRPKPAICPNARVLTCTCSIDNRDCDGRGTYTEHGTVGLDYMHPCERFGKQQA